MGKTLSECFVEIVERRGEHVAFMVKREGSWQSFDFDWGLEQAAKTAFGLESLGFEKGSRVAILSENRPEWATTDFGAMAAGFVGVPLYTTLIGEQIAYILHDAGVKVVFVSSMAHLSTVLSIRDRVPSIEKIVVFYPEDLEETDLVISLDTLKSMGEGHSREDFIELSRHVSPEDLATIVYTSGTTGDPKGVALTHHNFMAEFAAIWPIFEGKEGDSLLSFLPGRGFVRLALRLHDRLCRESGNPGREPARDPPDPHRRSAPGLREDPRPDPRRRAAGVSGQTGSLQLGARCRP
jgi:long-chain acyl-CoA synthetase